jgi:hypothetical protein
MQENLLALFHLLLKLVQLLECNATHLLYYLIAELLVPINVSSILQSLPNALIQLLLRLQPFHFQFFLFQLFLWLIFPQAFMPPPVLTSLFLSVFIERFLLPFALLLISNELSLTQLLFVFIKLSPSQAFPVLHPQPISSFVSLRPDLLRFRNLDALCYRPRVLCDFESSY